MDGFTDEQLAALAATIDTITFKSQPIESLTDWQSSIPKSNNEILEILVTENPDIKFDLYDSGLSWPICEDFPFSEQTLGITLDTDVFIDSQGLYSFPILQRLRLKMLGGRPSEDDINDMHLALFNSGVKTVEVDTKGMKIDDIEWLKENFTSSATDPYTITVLGGRGKKGISRNRSTKAKEF